MSVSSRVRNILKALDYTPSTFAKEAGISNSKAKRILEGTNHLYYNDIALIVSLTGINPNTLFGIRKGGASV